MIKFLQSQSAVDLHSTEHKDIADLLGTGFVTKTVDKFNTYAVQRRGSV